MRRRKMKKRLTKIAMVIFLMLVSFSYPAYASYDNLCNVTKSDIDETSLLQWTEHEARDVQYIEPRNSIISTAIADISNAGGGKIDILIETLAHVPCDEIRHEAFLEQWSDEYQDWFTVDSFLFVEYKDDNEDNKLTALTSTVTVSDQPSGYYYRVRGFHKVKLGDVSQGFTTRTDGVLITSK